MPVKVDAYKRRWVEVEFVLPGNQEQVFAAVATGAGMSSWFAKTTIEEKVGGELVFDMGGGMFSKGIVNAWEAPHRIAYEEREWMEGAPPCATEVVVAERHGGNSLVKMSHTLFWPDEKWDDQLESFEKGWPGFFEVLGIYLQDFAGQPASSFGASKVHPGTQAEAWTILTEALGFTAVDHGDRREAKAPAPALAGTVARVLQNAHSREILVRLEEPGGVALLGTYTWMDNTRASIAIYRYGEKAAASAAADEAAWTAFMDRLFPSKEEG